MKATKASLRAQKRSLAYSRLAAAIFAIEKEANPLEVLEIDPSLLPIVQPQDIRKFNNIIEFTDIERNNVRRRMVNLAFGLVNGQQVPLEEIAKRLKTTVGIVKHDIASLLYDIVWDNLVTEIRKIAHYC